MGALYRLSLSALVAILINPILMAQTGTVSAPGTLPGGVGRDPRIPHRGASGPIKVPGLPASGPILINPPTNPYDDDQDFLGTTIHPKADDNKNPEKEYEILGKTVPFKVPAGDPAPDWESRVDDRIREYRNTRQYIEDPPPEGTLDHPGERLTAEQQARLYEWRQIIVAGKKKADPAKLQQKQKEDAEKAEKEKEERLKKEKAESEARKQEALAKAEAARKAAYEQAAKEADIMRKEAEKQKEIARKQTEIAEKEKQLAADAKKRGEHELQAEATKASKAAAQKAVEAGEEQKKARVRAEEAHSRARWLDERQKAANAGAAARQAEANAKKEKDLQHTAKMAGEHELESDAHKQAESYRNTYRNEIEKANSYADAANRESSAQRHRENIIAVSSEVTYATGGIYMIESTYREPRTSPYPLPTHGVTDRHRSNAHASGAVDVISANASVEQYHVVASGSAAKLGSGYRAIVERPYTVKDSNGVEHRRQENTYYRAGQPPRMTDREIGPGDPSATGLHVHIEPL